MKSKKLKKKETATLVYKKIGGALADMTSGVKEKRFDKILKKASAALADDITKAAKKDEGEDNRKVKADKKSEKKADKKSEKKADKKNKAKKAGKKGVTEDRAGAPKMNNSPITVEAPAVVENVIP